MELGKPNISEVLTVQNVRFDIPAFQRAYSWDEEQWEELIDDLKTTMNKQTNHFMGAIVVQKVNDSLRIIIDGQQRLTTCFLLLLALAKWIKQYDSGNNYL